MKRIYTLFFLGLIGCFLPVQTANSCGYNPPVFRGYSLINPTVFEIPHSKPFYFKTNQFVSEFYGEQTEITHNENIREWKEYFCGIPTQKDVSNLIYNIDERHLNQLKSKEEYGNSYQMNDEWESNSLVNHLANFVHPYFVDYMIYAKKCEPHALNANQFGWYRRPEKADTTAINKLINLGRRRYDEVTEDFMKLRYAFQVVRLEHYYGDNPVAAYDELVKPLEHVESIMKYWALGHKGGYLTTSQNLSEKIEGNYLLTKVLFYSNFRQEAHLRSMNIHSDKEFNMLLNFCKNDLEKSTVFYIRALNKYSKAVEEMQEIYRIVPHSKKMEVLLIRELQKIEVALLKTDVDEFKEYQDKEKAMSKEAAKNYLKRLKPFVKKVAKDGKSANPALWISANGYLEFLDGNHRVAQTILKEAQKLPQLSPKLKDQIEVFQFALMLSIMNTMEDWMEDWVAELLQNNTAFQNAWGRGQVAFSYDRGKKKWSWLKSNTYYYDYDGHDYITEKLAELYHEKGDWGKAYLCRYSIHGLKYYPETWTIRQILELMDKPDKNIFEQFLLEKESIQSREVVLEILGTAYLGEHRLEEAISIFEQLLFLEPNLNDPFESRLNTHRPKDKNRREYSKLEVTKRVLELENALYGNPQNAAKIHLLLGNYHFNTSKFGHAWNAIDYFISGYEDDNFDHPLDFTTNRIWLGARGNKEFKDLSKSEYHFKKAMSLGNRELKAEACLMLSKIENQQFYLATDYYDKNRDAIREKSYRKWYKKMISNYSNTKYYEQVIEECSGFSAYAKK